MLIRLEAIDFKGVKTSKIGTKTVITSRIFQTKNRGIGFFSMWGPHIILETCMPSSSRIKTSSTLGLTITNS